MVYPHQTQNDSKNPIHPEQKYEIIDGIKSMLPSPTANHSRVTGNIFKIFSNYLEDKACEAFSETDIQLDERNTFKPDVMVICDPDVLKNSAKKLKGVPNLVVEVLSPGTLSHDKILKMKMYAQFGVKEYWIVDIFNRSIEIYLLKNNAFELARIHRLYTSDEIAEMNEDEKQDLQTEFTTTIFTDLFIPLMKIIKIPDAERRGIEDEGYDGGNRPKERGIKPVEIQ